MDYSWSAWLSLPQTFTILLRREADLLSEEAHKVRDVVEAHLASNGADAAGGRHQQALGTLDSGAEDKLDGRTAERLAEETSQMSLRHARHIGHRFRRHLVLHVVLDVGYHAEDAVVNIVDAFVGVLHEERPHNPHESLQLHLLIAVHIGVADDVLLVRRMSIELLRCPVGQVELRIIIAVVFKQQVDGVIGLYLMRKTIDVEEISLLAIVLIDKEIVELEPSLARDAVGHKARHDVHISRPCLQLCVRHDDGGVSRLDVVETDEGRRESCALPLLRGLGIPRIQHADIDEFQFGFHKSGKFGFRCNLHAKVIIKNECDSMARYNSVTNV